MPQPLYDRVPDGLDVYVEQYLPCIVALFSMHFCALLKSSYRDTLINPAICSVWLVLGARPKLWNRVPECYSLYQSSRLRIVPLKSIADWFLGLAFALICRHTIMLR